MGSKIALMVFTLAFIAHPALAVEKTRTWQTDRGTGSAKIDRSVDKDSKTLSGSRTVTGAAGKTATTNRTTVKTEDGYSVSGTRTGYNGNTQTYERDVAKTESGVQIKTQGTNNEGQGWTREQLLKRDGNTIQQQGMTTGPNGNTRDWSRTRTRENP